MISPSLGSFTFKELTCVIEEMKATGNDQNRHRVIVAAVLKTDPVLRALSGRPTFRQNTSEGDGASSTNILVAINMVSEKRYIEGTRAKMRF
jgi:hypothetical protein